MERAIEALRLFHQGYATITHRTDQAFAKTGYTSQEARVLMEIAALEECFGKDIMQTVPITKTNLSRIIGMLLQRKMITVKRHDEDRRVAQITITQAGREQALYLESVFTNELKSILGELRTSRHEQLAHHLEEVMVLFSMD